MNLFEHYYKKLEEECLVEGYFGPDFDGIDVSAFNKYLNVPTTVTINSGKKAGKSTKISITKIQPVETENGIRIEVSYTDKNGSNNTTSVYGTPAKCNTFSGNIFDQLIELLNNYNNSTGQIGTQTKQIAPQVETPNPAAQTLQHYKNTNNSTNTTEDRVRAVIKLQEDLINYSLETVTEYDPNMIAKLAQINLKLERIPGYKLILKGNNQELKNDIKNILEATRKEINRIKAYKNTVSEGRISKYITEKGIKTVSEDIWKRLAKRAADYIEDPYRPNNISMAVTDGQYIFPNAATAIAYIKADDIPDTLSSDEKKAIIKQCQKQGNLLYDAIEGKQHTQYNGIRYTLDSIPFMDYNFSYATPAQISNSKDVELDFLNNLVVEL